MLNLKSYQWEDISNLLDNFIESHLNVEEVVTDKIGVEYEVGGYSGPNWTDLGLHRLVERIVEVATGRQP